MIFELIKSPRFFPTVIIVLQACAAIRYGVAGSTWPAMYWLFAVGLNSVCTFGKLGK